MLERIQSVSHPPPLIEKQQEAPLGIVLLILESVGATAVSPLYAPPEGDGRPTAPFLSALAARPGASWGAHHYATMPNTNKAILELLCGLTPRLETSCARP